MTAHHCERKWKCIPPVKPTNGTPARTAAITPETLSYNAAPGTGLHPAGSEEEHVRFKLAVGDQVGTDAAVNMLQDP